MAGTSRSDGWGQLENQKILICGAGIAGPTMAYWLQRSGFEPTLIERAPALREGGYIVDFWGFVFDVAEKNPFEAKSSALRLLNPDRPEAPGARREVNHRAKHRVTGSAELRCYESRGGTFEKRGPSPSAMVGCADRGPRQSHATLSHMPVSR